MTEIKYLKEGFEISLSGTLTSKEILDANNETLNHEKLSSCKYLLWIFKSIEALNINADELRNMSMIDRKISTKNPGIKVAIVSDSPLAFGLACMYKGYSSGSESETMVFYDIDKAYEWIRS
jgi:hypothetical protein